ncbi:MAG: DUF177 domain-containing protein [Chloroflexi bacterium]|nr:DUF177 domain-containing protein [Chloroflexota bacterium]
MIFNVSQLLREPTGASRGYDIDEPIEVPIEGARPAHVDGTLELIRTPRGLVARADLQLETDVPCSRCLGTAGLSPRLTIEEEFLPTVDPFTSARLPEPDDPTAFRIDELHHVDLTEAVRQAAVLNEPMQPLCRPDCRGLCATCGADLNAGACGCPPEPADERWSALQQLKLD